MKRSFLTLLCSLLCLFVLIPAAHAKDPKPNREQPPAWVCPCPCDTAAVADWLDAQLAQLANEMGPIGTDPANQIANDLRKIGQDLKQGNITLDEAIARLGKQIEKIERLIESIKQQMKDIKDDTEMTRKAKKSALEKLQKQLDILNVILNGVTNKKGEKVKPGLKDLLDCLKKCQNP